MMGNKIKLILWTLSMILIACEPQGMTEDGFATMKVELLTEGVDEVSDIVLTAHDINMNKDYSDTTLIMTLPMGYYDLTFKGKGDGRQMRAYQRGVKITANTTVHMNAIIVQNKQDFVLAEIFFAGTETPEGKRYVGDKYFVVYNNADDTLSADGLTLVEADLNSTQKYDLGEQDFRKKYFSVDAIYRIPGDGNTYRVAPGKAILIADNAMNHTQVNANSWDLSHADFEWYDISSSAGATDVDNPNVTNLEKIYCYTKTIWVPHNQGNKSFGLARLPQGMTAAEYLAIDSLYITYNYELVTEAGTFSRTGKSYVMPNEWMVDVINMAPLTTFQWLTSSDTLDAGFAYVASTGKDVTRFGKAVRRKIVDWTDGHRVLQDTNNSSEDCEMGVPANPFYFK